MATAPSAELDRESRVYALEVVTDVGVATAILRCFFLAASVGTVRAVIGEDAVHRAIDAAIRAEVVLRTVHVHPGNRLAGILRDVNVPVCHCVNGDSADAVLEYLGQRVGDHGTEAAARYEHARGIDAVVFFELGEEFVKEDVVLVIASAPGASVRIATRSDKDEFVVLVEILLAIVRRRMIGVSA